MSSIKKKINVLGLGSTKQVGKDTFCANLAGSGISVRRFAFADALKNLTSPIAHEFFGAAPDELYGAEKELFRKVLITVGELGREIDPGFWVNKVRLAVLESLSSPDIDLRVITDMRYPNEVNAFRQAFGEDFMYVQLERIGAPDPTPSEMIHLEEMRILADHTIIWNSDKGSILTTIESFKRNFL